MTLHYYLGRQPIFDSALHVVGYELLYRAHAQSISGLNSDEATSNVILNLLETGLDEIVGAHAAYINLTEHFLVNNLLPMPSIHQIVFEILEDVEADSKVIESVRKLKSLGYGLALDDFVYHQELNPLLQLANIVKLDIQALTHDQIEQHVSLLKKYPVKIVAEKVETPAELDYCRSLGFDHYQGFFLCRPQIRKSKRLSENHLVALQLLQELNNPESDIKALDEVIRRDVALSFKLLRYINSAAFGLGHEIESIRHAIVYLGINEVRKWASLIALSNINDKPDELMITSLVRAKMCELLTNYTGQGNPGTAFIVGLFSTLDAMMDTPLEELLKSLPVVNDVKETLLQAQGVYRNYLDSVLAYEKADWTKIDANRIQQLAISDIYLQSIRWADNTTKGLLT